MSRNDEEEAMGSQEETSGSASKERRGSAFLPRILRQIRREETSSRSLDKLSLSYMSPKIVDAFPGNVALDVSVLIQTEESWLQQHYRRKMGGGSSEEKILSTSCSSDKEIYSALAQEFSDISVLSDTEFTAKYLALLEESVRTLPSVGPPVILAYKPESLEKGRMFPELQMGQDRSAYVPCEFCGRELKPFPTYEQYKMDSPKKFFCCKQYKNLYEFLANEEKNLLNEEKIEPISIEPHKPYISKFKRQTKFLHIERKNLWQKVKTEALPTAPYEPYQEDLRRQKQQAKKSQDLHELPHIKQKKLQQKDETESLSVTSQKSYQSEPKRQKAKEKQNVSDFSDDGKDHLQMKDKTKTLHATPHKSRSRGLKRQRQKEKQDLSDFSDVEEDHLRRKDKTKTRSVAPRKSHSGEQERQRKEEKQDLSDFSDVEEDHLRRKDKTKKLSVVSLKSHSDELERQRAEEEQDLSDFSDDEDKHLPKKDKTKTLTVSPRKSHSDEKQSAEEELDLSDFSDEDDRSQRKFKTKKRSVAPQKSHRDKFEKQRAEDEQDLSDFSDEDDRSQRKFKTKKRSVASRKSHRDKFEKQRAEEQQDLSSFSDDEDEHSRRKDKTKTLAATVRKSHTSEHEKQVKKKKTLSDVSQDKQKKLWHKEKSEAASTVPHKFHSSEPESQQANLAKSPHEKQKHLRQDGKTEAIFSTLQKPHQGDTEKQVLQSKETWDLRELPQDEEKRLQYEDKTDNLSVIFDKSHIQRLQEGHFDRHHEFLTSELSSSSEMPDSHHLKTISFNLSDSLRDNWTFAVPPEKLYAEPSNYNITTCDFTVACEKMMPRKFLEKYYKDGGKFLTLFPDGTAQLFYPSGNLAIIIIGNDLKNFCCIVYADKSNNADIQAMFESNGKGTCYHPNGTIWVNMNALGGQFIDDMGNRVKTWQWKSSLIEGAPSSFKPIFISLSHYIGVRILCQDKIIVSFLAMGRQARFRLGIKVQVTAPEPLPPKQVSIEELLLFASKIKIQILFNKLNEFLNCPSNIQWTKMKPPPYLVSQTQKLIYLCRLSSLGREVDTLVRAIIDEHS